MSELCRLFNCSVGTPRPPLFLRQRGMMSLFAIVFLLVVVIFALSQTLNMSASNIVDTKEQRDSVAALYLAESGLERVMRPLTVAAQSGALTSASCTGLAGSSSSSELGGSFSIVPTSDPTDCGGSFPVCSNCTVKVTGTVGSAKRTINLVIAVAPQNGVTGFGGTSTSSPPGITLAATNTEATPAAMMFNLAWRRLGSDGQPVVAGGQADATDCGGCTTYWDILSSSGNNAVGSMGVFNTLAVGETKTVVQTLDIERNYAEVGAIFVSASSSPVSQSGSYWNEQGGVGSADTTTGGAGAGVETRKTNNGAFSSSGTSSPVTDDKQTATNWCWGANTLVAGFSGRSTSAETLSPPFMFGPKELSPVAQLPHPAGDIYAEIWAGYNTNYYSSPTPTTPDDRATSYPVMVIGSIGASFTGAVSNNSNQMVVSTVTSGRLWPGDVVSGTNRIPAGTTVTSTSFPAGGLTGTYTLSAQATGNDNSFPGVAASTTLTTGLVTRGPLASSVAISGSGVTAGTTVVSGPDGSGNYLLSTAQQVVSTAITQGVSGTTISVPTGSPLPSAGTMVAVQHGIGAFAAGTTVSTVGVDSFTISAAPTTAMTGGTVCGGTCAFFNHDPTVNGGLTDFSIVKGSGTTQWAAGFSCLGGVNSALTRPITTLKVQPTTWTESF